ncbi:MAG: outer membrane beta-barrel protein [Candidatus Kapaibacterium sp.]
MKTVFSLLFLLSVLALQAQPVPKYDLGLNGGVILQSKSGADRATGGLNGLYYYISDYGQTFYTKQIYSLFLPTESITHENAMSTLGIATIGYMADPNWQICASAGQYFGKSTSTFSSTIQFREIVKPDTIYTTVKVPGTMEVTLGGWLLELGARYHFGTDIHPYVGAGLRYNTQAVSKATLTLDGKSIAILERHFYESISEIGGYVGAGVKIPLSKVFCIDVQADLNIRNAKEGEVHNGSYETALAFEPAFRAGVSFDLNSIFDIGKHPSDYDDDDAPKTKTKAKPKTPKAPGPTDK